MKKNVDKRKINKSKRKKVKNILNIIDCDDEYIDLMFEDADDKEKLKDYTKENEWD